MNSVIAKKTLAARIALLAASVIVGVAFVPVAFAGRGGGGVKGGGGCTRNTPGVSVANTWQWGVPGSWGLAGQQLKYAISVINADAGCSSSSFAVTLSAPSGFAVSIPTNTIALSSGASGYVWAYVTSPKPIAEGNYPLSVTVVRTATSGLTASDTSYYKVYSSDSVAPSLYFPAPGDGATISGKGSFNISVSSNDDHEVKQIDLYVDNAYTTTSVCADITYDCTLYYPWGLVKGQHTATFKSYDWMGNVRVMTVTFTVT